MSHSCHSHPRTSLRLMILIVALNIVFVLAQVWYGLQAHSLALLADAGHNFGDLLGLILATIAIGIAYLRPNHTYTYGLQSATILATLANTILLLLTVFELTHQAIERLLEPSGLQPDHTTVIWVAAAAVVVNGFTAWVLHQGDKNDLNIRGMYLHMLSDTAVSVGVILGAIVMSVTGWVWLDATLSLIIAAVILYAAWGLLRRTLRLSLQGVPTHIKAQQVRQSLLARPGVTDLHDLHIWALGTQQVALSAHLIMPTGCPSDTFIEETAQELRQLGIHHTTLQIERGQKHCHHCECGH